MKKKMSLTVDFPNLCKVLVKSQPHPGVAMGLGIVLSVLRKIAERAEEIKDEVILEQLKRISGTK